MGLDEEAARAAVVNAVIAAVNVEDRLRKQEAMLGAKENLDCHDDFERVLHGLGMKRQELGTEQQQRLRFLMFCKAMDFVREQNKAAGEEMLQVDFRGLLSPEDYAENGSFVIDEYQDSSAEKDEDADSSNDMMLRGEALEETWDWRSMGAVSSVRNQGSCGSCWAFATVGSVASRLAIERQYLFDLSPQQVLDCFRPDRYGCRGGSFATVLREITFPLQTFDDRPYEGGVNPSVNGGTCARESTLRGVASVVGGATVLSRPTNDRIRRALREQGPLAAAVESHSHCFQFYRRGILDDAACRPGETMGKPNHAVLLVGWQDWGTDRAAWIVRNSWGRQWGQNGDVLIKVVPEDVKSDGNFAIRTILAAPSRVDFAPRCHSDMSSCLSQAKYTNLTIRNTPDTPYQGVNYTFAYAILFLAVLLSIYSTLRLLLQKCCASSKPSEPLAEPISDFDYVQLEPSLPAASPFANTRGGSR